MTDTIVAVSSPPGRGVAAILRLSGPLAVATVRALAGGLEGEWERGGRVLGATLQVGGVPVRASVQIHRAPRSYTREDTVEVFLPGAPPLVRLLAHAVLGDPAAVGREGTSVRWARPGEFTLRAFLNGRIDLSQAEAVAMLIGASGQEEARASRRSLRGGLAGPCRDLAASVLETIALLEAGLDFPDEDLSEISKDLSREAVGERIASLVASQERLLGVTALRIPRPGLVRAAIAGFPNAGKSSLLNALLGRDAAIACDLPGTTRDPVRGTTSHGGRSIEWVDLAGAWSAGGYLAGLPSGTDDPAGGGDAAGAGHAAGPGDAADPVVAPIAEPMATPVAKPVAERADPGARTIREIVERLSRIEIESADVVVWVVDPRDAPEASLRQYAALDVPRKLLVLAKSDLPGLDEAMRLAARVDVPSTVSARSGTGLDVVVERVLDLAGRPGGTPGGLRGAPPPGGAQGAGPPGACQLLVSAHQEAALSVAGDALRRARDAVAMGTELVVSDLRDAMEALESITGASPREAVLDRIFSRLCIGK